MSKNLGIYIHIPYCERKCLYCDFLSFAPERAAEYIGALCKEIELAAKKIRASQLVERKVAPHLDERKTAPHPEERSERGISTRADTVFIGGGTPSVLSSNHIGRIMEAIYENFDIDKDAEITIESNPNSLTIEKLKVYRSFGINRLSLGVQSLDDKVLKALGRLHDAKTAERAYYMAREAGFENINLDLMFAVPEQSHESWIKSLGKAARELKPEHISFYSLQLEEGTPFFKMWERGELKETPAELDRKMYHDAMALLKCENYEHYEISNAAKKGRECRHNMKYWSMEEYLGLGLGASSFIGGHRLENTRKLGEYIESLSRKKLPIESDHKNSEYDMSSEYIFTGLRKRKGIELEDFRMRFGEDLLERDRIQYYVNNGALITDNGFIKLSEEAIDISNKILADII